MEQNRVWSGMPVISTALHIVICCHHRGIHLTGAHVGVMGNIHGTNYREPTGRDCAAFGGLTFDCWVNSRMKIFNPLPESNQIYKEETDPRKQLEGGYVHHTNTFYCCVQFVQTIFQLL